MGGGVDEYEMRSFTGQFGNVDNWRFPYFVRNGSAEENKYRTMPQQADGIEDDANGGNDSE